MITISENSLSIPRCAPDQDPLAYLSEQVLAQLAPTATPIRFVITAMTSSQFDCEVAVVHDSGGNNRRLEQGVIFEFRKRSYTNDSVFNAVFLVPTGIGAEIGGHAGDAGATARLLAQACDGLITHPNVMNASDINELPENSFYVEGSVIARLLMGTVSLQPTRANRILVLMDPHPIQRYRDATINMVSAARSAAGFACPEIIIMETPLLMRSGYADSGRAVGRIEGLGTVCKILERHRGSYDAVAIASKIEVPSNFHSEYFAENATDMVNPWGGVEAMLTHSVSLLYDVPSAHAPMMSSDQVRDLELGTVDPRKAAEPVSLTYLFSILKGLHRSPRIVSTPSMGSSPGLIGVSDIHCLVIPDGCIGLPTLAALAQGIPVIAVRENRNRMRNSLSELPFGSGQLYVVDNYLESAGVMSALRGGVSPDAVRRPLARTIVRKQRGDDIG